MRESEDLFGVGRGNPRAVVGETQSAASRARLQFDRDGERCVADRIDRVLDELGQHLFQLNRIRAQADLGGGSKRALDARPGLQQHGNALAQPGTELEVLDPAAAGPGKSLQVGDQAIQPAHLLADRGVDLGLLALFGTAPLEDLNRAVDAGQRVAHLVRDL